MDLRASDDVRRLLATFLKFARAEWSKGSLIGIKPSEMRVLFCIKDLSNVDNGGVTVSDISKHLFITSPSVTQIIKGLSASGYIERTVNHKDRRIANIKLTHSGEQKVQRARELILEKYSGLHESLGKEKSDTLISLLDEVYTYFEQSNKRTPPE